MSSMAAPIAQSAWQVHRLRVVSAGYRGLSTTEAAMRAAACCCARRSEGRGGGGAIMRKEITQTLCALPQRAGAGIVAEAMEPLSSKIAVVARASAALGMIRGMAVSFSRGL